MAQGTELGQNVNAKHAAKELGGNLIAAGDHGVFTRVDFDVSVSAETAGKGGVSLMVWGVGIEAGADKKMGAANRLVFSVPVRLPEGDAKKADQIEGESRAKIAQLPTSSRGRGPV